MRVLVIDDDASIRSLLEFVFTLEGLEGFFASNGADGIALAAELQPDAIVLDIMMPEMNGREVAAMLFQNDDTADIPIIFCSALGDEEDIWDGWQRGASSYLPKPFDSDQLLEEIVRVVTPMAA